MSIIVACPAPTKHTIPFRSTIFSPSLCPPCPAPTSPVARRSPYLALLPSHALSSASPSTSAPRLPKAFRGRPLPTYALPHRLSLILRRLAITNLTINVALTPHRTAPRLASPPSPLTVARSAARTHDEQTPPTSAPRAYSDPDSTAQQTRVYNLRRDTDASLNPTHQRGYAKHIDTTHRTNVPAPRTHRLGTSTSARLYFPPRRYVRMYALVSPCVQQVP